MLELTFSPIFNILGTALGWIGSLLLWILKFCMAFLLNQLIWGAFVLLFYVVCAILKAILGVLSPSDPTSSPQETPAEKPVVSVARQKYLDECERLRQLDALGSVTAAYRLYALIRNKEPRNPEWLACLKRAAHELDNYEAQYKLASGYENGSIREDGITEEDIVALYRRAAAQGYRKASNRLKAMGLADEDDATA